MSASRRRPVDFVRAGTIPLGFLLLAAWIASESLHMPLGTFQMPGAGFFPLGLGLLLGILALLLWAAQGPDPAASDAAQPTQRAEVICLTVCLVAAAWLFERVGFLITMAVFLTVTTAMLGRIAWWRAAALAAVGTAAAWLVFVRVLKIALPSGVSPL